MDTSQQMKKSKLPVLKKRLTQKSQSEKLDFLPNLPEEMSIEILKYVSVNDLGKCLNVSKAWHKMVNINSIWKKLCQEYGVNPYEDPYDDENFVKNENSTLCEWAQIWQRFRNSPSYGWRTNCWQTKEYNRKFDNSSQYIKQCSSDGNSIVFCTESCLIVRRAAQLGTDRRHKIILPFTSNTLTDVAVKNEYIAVAQCNIIVIYKECQHRFRSILALALHNNTCTKAYASIPEFVRSRFSSDSPSISILAFKDSCIWFRELIGFEGRSKIYILNLKNNKISKVELAEPSFYWCTIRAYLLTWSWRELRVDDFEGRNVLKVSLENGWNIYEARSNNNVLVMSAFRKNNNLNEQTLETWDIVNRQRLLCQPQTVRASIEIHPTRKIFYQFEARKSYITCVCAETGTMHWTLQVPVFGDIFWVLRIVNQRYLLISPEVESRRSEQLYVCDINKGEFLYRTERPPGDLVHVSDYVHITQTFRKIFVKTCFNAKC